MPHSAPVFEVDFRAEPFARNPYPTYAQLRSEFPVCQLASGTHILSRYDDVKFALKNHHLFASGWADAPIIHPGWLSEECKRGVFLPEIDPPLHTTYREIVKKSFVGKSVEELIPKIREAALALAAQIREKGRAEVLNDFAYPLASSVVENITGLNIKEDVERTRTWIELLESFTSTSPEPEKKAEIEALIIEQNEYYDELIRSRRESPKNDLATALANANVDGKPLPPDQLRSALNLFTLGGFEAPAQLLAKSILVLSRRPDLVDLLSKHPECISPFIEEMTRFSNSAQGSMRMTKEPIMLHGTLIPPNSAILALIGSANRDPSHFPDPDSFIIDRNNIKTHLGFGHGVHVCIGAAVARIEINIGLQVFLSTFKQIECPSEVELDWTSTPVGRVLRSLDVQLD